MKSPYILSLLFLASLAGTHLNAADSRQPNVLFISIDDLNDWVGGLGGHPQAITPHMDRLFEQGLLFSNAHCSQAVCTASRNSLLSGLHQGGMDPRQPCAALLMPSWGITKCCPNTLKTTAIRRSRWGKYFTMAYPITKTAPKTSGMR
jgi:hypothetical protein